jgi:16S rRNA (guanine966-N2)-methyltransferase
VRVIAGAAGGTRLARVPGGTRPLSDRAREGLFASLGQRVEGARCVDLFAGTGAVGIEALSRGAAACDFVDSSARAARAIRENLSRTSLKDGGTVIRADVARFLGRAGVGPWDLAFLDPPYAYPKGRLRAVIGSLQPHLATGATTALTRPARDATDVIPVHFEVTKRLSYGDALILVLEGQ